MPSFNNYTFTNIQYTIPEGDNVSILYPTAQITIVPNSGYTAVAADFSLDPSFSDNAVQSVVFTQDGSNVLCTVTFDTGFVMPSGNYTIPLCVVGEGAVNSITIGGTISADVGTNITGDVTENNTPYSNSGDLGEAELLLTRTYTADAGYYLNSSGLQVLEGNASNYLIVQSPTYDLDNNVTGLSYAVNYIYPNQDISGDKLQIKQVSAREIYIAPAFVTSYSPLPVTVNPYGEIVTNWRIFGGVGAMFTVIMTDTLGNSTTLVDNEAIRTCCGDYYVQVVIPSIIGVVNEELYTITLSGDIDPDFAQENPIQIYQSAVLPRIGLTAISTYGVTGYNLIEEQGPAYTILPSPQAIPVEWTLTVPSGTLNLPSLSVDYDAIVLDNNQIAYPVATSDQSNVGSIDVDSTTGILPGDVFNNTLVTAFTQTPTGNETALDASLYSPFEYTVTSVNSGTNISVTPNISIANDFRLTIVRNGGDVVDLSNIVLTQIDDTTVKLNAIFNISAFGYIDKTFTLNLDQVLEFTPAALCGVVIPSGGEGVTDLSVELDPAGGIVCFLVDPIGVPDKFELIHGLAGGTKVATSGMNTTGNTGPFDNVFGAEPINLTPTVLQATNTLQFIGTDKGTIDTRQTEFNAATGETIATMTVGGNTYEQVLWWEYSAADYITNPNVTFRTTGPSGTGWSALRVCFP